MMQCTSFRVPACDWHRVSTAPLLATQPQFSEVSFNFHRSITMSPYFLTCVGNLCFSFFYLCPSSQGFIDFIDYPSHPLPKELAFCFIDFALFSCFQFDFCSYIIPFLLLPLSLSFSSFFFFFFLVSWVRNLHSFFFFNLFCCYFLIISIPSMGLELLTVRSRVSHSSD